MFFILAILVILLVALVYIVTNVTIHWAKVTSSLVMGVALALFISVLAGSIATTAAMLCTVIVFIYIIVCITWLMIF